MQRLTIKKILFILFAFCTTLANAQNTLEGFVKDKNTGELLPGASIAVMGTSLGAASNFEGYYILKKIPSGKQTIHVSYIGFKNQTFDIEFSEGKLVKKDLALEPDGVQLTDVIITAQARGQMEAINAQLTAVEIKNVVSSDKIQDIPDANAAESIGRLPGVSVSRNGGEANKVIIRGMQPQFSKINIQGMEMASTDGENRSTDISMISPYSLDGIEVVKAITPDMDGEAVGGAVNLKLRKAKKDWHGGFALQGGYNGLANEFGDYLVTGNVSNRFFNNKLGVFVQANKEQRNRSEIFEEYKWQGVPYSEQEEFARLYHSQDQRKEVERTKNRTGATLILDSKWKGGSVVLSNFYSSAKTNEFSQTEMVNGTERTNKRSGYIRELQLDVINSGINFEQDYKGFKIDALLAHSYSKRDKPYNYHWEFVPKTGNIHKVLNEEVRFMYDVPINGWYDHLLPAADSVKILNNLTYENEANDERIYTAKLNLKYDFNINEFIAGNIKFGGKYRKRVRNFDKTVSNNAIATSSELTLRQLVREKLPNEVGQYTSESPEFLDFPLFGTPANGELDVDLMQEVARIALYNDGYYDNLEDYNSSTTSALINTNHLQKSIKPDYEGTEELMACYVMAELNIFKKFIIIPGIRYENNVTDYTGLVGDARNFPQWNYPYRDTSIKRTNSNLLPMLHLRYKPFDWFDVRFAYTNTLARPNYNKIKPLWEYGNNGLGFINTGIKPSTSENLDLYFSFHSNKLGLFTIGGFQKKIDGMILKGIDGGSTSVYIQDTSRSERLDAYYEFGVTKDEVGKKVSYDINNPYQANLKGIEVEWQTSLYWLPGLLNGIVFNTNYTYTWSEAYYPFTRFKVKYEDNPIPGLPPIETYHPQDTFHIKPLSAQPKHIVNFTIGYDIKGFSARLSMLYQHKVISKQDRWKPQEEFKDNYLRWDLSLKQDLGFWFKGLQAYANFNNLGRETDDVYRNGIKEPRLITMHDYGYTFDLGIRYRF